MAEISHKGLWIKWASMGATDRILFTVSIFLAAVGGGFSGLLLGIRKAGDDGKFDDLLGIGGTAVGMIAMVILGVAFSIYVVFIARQDELFQRFHVLSGLWCGGGLLLATFFGIVAPGFGWNWFSHEHVLYCGVIFLIAGCFFYSRKLY